MALKWPFPDLFKPQFNSWQMTAPGVTRRTEFEGGEDRVRRTADFRPFRQRFDIDIGRADFAVLRRWFYEDADGGRLWFEMPVFVDDAYATVEARIVDDGNGPFSLRLVGDFDYRVTMEVEIRRLPRVPDAVYYSRQGGR